MGRRRERDATGPLLREPLARGALGRGVRATGRDRGVHRLQPRPLHHRAAQVEQYLREKWILPVAVDGHGHRLRLAGDRAGPLARPERHGCPLRRADARGRARPRPRGHAGGRGLPRGAGAGARPLARGHGHDLGVAQQRDWDHALAPADTVTTSDALSPSSRRSRSPWRTRSARPTTSSSPPSRRSRSPAASSGSTPSRSRMRPGRASLSWPNLAAGVATPHGVRLRPAPVMRAGGAGDQRAPGGALHRAGWLPITHRATGVDGRLHARRRRAHVGRRTQRSSGRPGIRNFLDRLPRRRLRTSPTWRAGSTATGRAPRARPP